MIKLIGITYALLFTFCYIPQILKLLRTKQTAGISIGMYWICLIGYILAIIYAILAANSDLVLLLSNSLCLLMCSYTIYLYYKNVI